MVNINNSREQYNQQHNETWSDDWIETNGLAAWHRLRVEYTRGTESFDLQVAAFDGID